MDAREGPIFFSTDGLGVFGAEAPNRAARAVGNDTTVANRARPPPRRGSMRIRGFCSRAAASRPFGRASLTRPSPEKAKSRDKTAVPALHFFDLSRQQER